MNNGEIVIYQNNEGDIKLDVRLEDETVWLSQAQLALLFNKDKRTITEHINNIFKEGELDEKVVVRKFRLTTQHGAIAGKIQQVEVNAYNLDVIISVGYRVKSQQVHYTCIFRAKLTPYSEQTDPHSEKLTPLKTNQS